MWYHLRLLEQCNLSCAHCYARSRDRSEYMSMAMIADISGQIKGIQAKQDDNTVVYLSGGEPFLHPEFEKILDMLSTKPYIDRINILTNGILVCTWLDTLCKYRDKIGVQISVDGDEDIHDKIRGQGVFEKASNALYILNDSDISHWISYTVSRINSHCFKDILALALATQSNFNNVTPYTGDDSKMLSYLQWKEFKYRYRKYAEEIGLENPHGKNACGFTYRCGACTSGITVNPDGTITGCARDNRVLGNYKQLESIITNEAPLMNTTCMRKAWGRIEHFLLVASLE